MTLSVLEALSWVFEDEYSPYSEYVAGVLNGRHAVVPVVWPLEVANSLLTAVRRGRLREADAPVLIGAIDRLRINIDRGIAPESPARTTLAVGLAYGVSAYDASYLELAMRRSMPLATQDKRLARAAADDCQRDERRLERRKSHRLLAHGIGDANRIDTYQQRRHRHRSAAQLGSMTRGGGGR